MSPLISLPRNQKQKNKIERFGSTLRQFATQSAPKQHSKSGPRKKDFKKLKKGFCPNGQLMCSAASDEPGGSFYWIAKNCKNRMVLAF